MSELRFGGHMIGEPIGGGAHSSVFRAAQEGTGRTVAIKALKLDVSPTSSFGAEVEREARVLTRLAHPSIVMLLDHGRAPSGRPFMVLEYVDGWTLAELLAKRPRGLEPEVALAIASEVGAALDHAHRRGVVHRDVAPTNILLSRDGDVKLIDFGQAQLEGAEPDDEVTHSGRMAEPLGAALGTPAYCSPEQILGDFVDGRSDLFSLGAVLYEMLCGARPFDPPGGGKAKVSVAQRVRREPPTPLRAHAPETPRALERIVTRLLEKSPSDRYPSAGVAVEKLRTALRTTTRDAPSEIVRGALASGGLLPKEAARRPAPRTTGATRKAAAGFAAILAFFAIGGVLIRRADSSVSPLARARETAPSERGGLRVLASPWADVAVDGAHVETTPFAKPVSLSPGKHWVRLTHPDAPPVERDVTIVRGEVSTLEVVMDLKPLSDAGRDAR
jgi:eukaryotic-like serine/threonine-protein kinase